MNTWFKRAVATCLAGGVAVCAGYAWYAMVAARLAKAERARLAAEIHVGELELSALQTRSSDAESDARLLRRALESFKTAKAEPADANPPTKPPLRPSLNILDLIRDDPKAELLYLESQRAQLATNYGPLFRELGLSTAEVARFQDNVIKRDTQRMDLKSVRQRSGKEADLESLAKLEAVADADYMSAQRELLGDSRYSALHEYERTASIRSMVSAIAGIAAVEGVPFAPAQAGRLVQALADASESYRAGGAVNARDTDWDAVDARAKTILSPSQLELFRTMDPGPSMGGLLQKRMYSLVDRANLKERKSATSHPAR